MEFFDKDIFRYTGQQYSLELGGNSEYKLVPTRGDFTHADVINISHKHLLTGLKKGVLVHETTQNPEPLPYDEWMVKQEEKQHQKELEFLRKDYSVEGNKKAINELEKAGGNWRDVDKLEMKRQLEQEVALERFEAAKKGFISGSEVIEVEPKGVSDWEENPLIYKDYNEEYEDWEDEGWEDEIAELEKFFSSVELPSNAIQLDAVTRITDIPSFIISHMKFVKENQGNKVFEPYLDSLIKLKELLDKSVM